MMFSPTIPDHLCRKRPANMKTQTLSIDLLRIDANTQSRLAINQEVVEEYAEVIAAAGTDWPFPNLDVFHDGTDYYVADGFHRKLGGLRAKRGSIPCNIHEGTATDARIFGMTANDRHGLRMSRADKRAGVEWLLDGTPKRTQTEIAELAGVSARWVRQIVADRNAETLKGKMKTASTGSKATPPNATGSCSSNTPSSGVNSETTPLESDTADGAQQIDQDDPLYVPEGPEPDLSTPDTWTDAKPAPAGKPKPPVKALEGREARVFDVHQQIGIWRTAVGKWLVTIDEYRAEFPTKQGDQAIDAAKAVYEVFDKWSRAIK